MLEGNAFFTWNRIDLDISVDRDQAFLWLNENTNSKDWTWYSAPFDRQYTIFYIKDPKIAVLFKLTFF